MYRLFPLALALTSALALPRAHAQEPAPTGQPILSGRLILTLEGSRPDLDALRGAIRERDGSRARDLAAEAERSARAGRADLERAIEALGGRVIEHFWLIDGCVVEVPGATAEALADLPGVVRVWEDSTRAPGDLAAPIRTSTNVDNHNTDQVQIRGVRGAGVTVAVVDSGLDSAVSTLTRPHRTFFVNGDPTNPTGGGLSGSRMLANVQVGSFPADDPIDHGTRVAAVAIGARWNSTIAADDGHAPLAKVVGYGLVDTSNGFTAVATMVRAWQLCALDAATYGTKVAVISYEGTDDPTSPEQQAMDACAEVADICVASMAGNSPTSQIFYQAATNVLAVGAVTQDTHLATNFTARGPLLSAGTAPRIYPHLVANGDLIEMPTADREATSVVRSGTSYSAPQVAGAAALFRSVATTASADETRAAILATVADGRGPNVVHVDAIGHGYLRVDRLIDLAQRRIGGLVAAGSVRSGSPTWTTTLQANAGEVHAAALAFSRRNVGTTSWANLDLRVTQGGVLLGESRGVADTHERVVFRAIATGLVTIEVSAQSFEVGTVTQSFGVAAARIPLPMVMTYGSGCEGSRGPSTVREVEPMFLSGFGNAASDRLIGGTAHRTQQWIDTGSPSAAFYVRGLALRHDDAATSGPWQRSWVELDVTFALTMDTPNNVSTTFAQNFGRLPTEVIQRKRFVLPSIAAPNGNANDFRVVLPLDQNFSRQYDAVGPNPGSVHDLIVDVRTYATSAGAAGLSYPLDAVSNFGGGAVTLFANSPTATVGTLFPGEATVIGLVGTLGAARLATLDLVGFPDLGARYDLSVGGAGANTQVFFGLGPSRTSIGGTPLPLELGFIGAPGCFVLNDLEALIPAAANGSGTATISLAVPTSINLRGREMFHQGLVFDATANPLGLITTRGVGVVFGQ